MDHLLFSFRVLRSIEVKDKRRPLLCPLNWSANHKLHTVEYNGFYAWRQQRCIVLIEDATDNSEVDA